MAERIFSEVLIFADTLCLAATFADDAAVFVQIMESLNKRRRVLEEHWKHSLDATDGDLFKNLRATRVTHRRIQTVIDKVHNGNLDEASKMATELAEHGYTFLQESPLARRSHIATEFLKEGF